MGFITSVESLGIYVNDESGITEEREESVQNHPLGVTFHGRKLYVTGRKQRKERDGF